MGLISWFVSRRNDRKGRANGAASQAAAVSAAASEAVPAAQANEPRATSAGDGRPSWAAGWPYRPVQLSDGGWASPAYAESLRRWPLTRGEGSDLIDRFFDLI